MSGALFAPYTPDEEYSDQHYGSRYRFRFGNGYQASVVRGRWTYGGPAGLWELAVMDRKGRICYDTPITDDVVGWLEVRQVVDLLRRIEVLPPRDEEVPGGVDR
jgi:hypothetical protein